jgi:hypothetical protein
MTTKNHDMESASDDVYIVDQNTLNDMVGDSNAYRAAAEQLETERFATADVKESNVIEVPLPADKISEFESFCRRVTGYKLDDFPPGSCKRGTRRESKCRVLGPFTLEGKRVINTATGEAYALVECRDGRYISDSTKENATGCVGRGEMHGTPQGSWKILVKKGLGVPDQKVTEARKDHDDDYGRHAQIAAYDMCHQMVAYIYDHLN